MDLAVNKTQQSFANVEAYGNMGHPHPKIVVDVSDY